MEVVNSNDWPDCDNLLEKLECKWMALSLHVDFCGAGSINATEHFDLLNTTRNDKTLSKAICNISMRVPDVNVI